MFRAAYRSSSGVPNCISSLWFTYTCGDRPLSSLSGKCTQTWQRQVTTCVCKPEAANTVWSSWWWAVCRSKHVKPSINFGIINSITRLRLVGYFYWFMGKKIFSHKKMTPGLLLVHSVFQLLYWLRQFKWPLLVYPEKKLEKYSISFTPVTWKWRLVRGTVNL